MKAWLLERIGDGLRNMHVADAPDPQPAAGEVLLEVQYAALNPADRYLTEGQYPAHPPLPHVLGREAVGRVAAMGLGVEHLRIGQKMVLLRGDVGVERWGTFAQRVAAPAESLVPVPDGWSDQEAAASVVGHLTAYQALTQWGHLPSPALVLVTGASGGVGVASIQLAVAMGHTAVALSRSAEKRLRLVQIGAALALDPQDTQWRARLKDSYGARHVDLAIDNIGGSLLPEVVTTLGMWGRVSIVGRLAGPVPQFNTSTLLFRRIRLGGVAVGTYGESEGRLAWQNVLALLSKTGARPLVDRVFPFDQLPAAFDRLAEGPMGKVLVRIGAE